MARYSEKKYRSLENITIVEFLIKDIFENNYKNLTPTIFKNINTHINKLKKKELKILKPLTAYYILQNLHKEKQSLDNLLKIINKSKNANCIHFYKNNIYFYTQIYSICKYNLNYNKILQNSEIDIDYSIARFFNYLYKSKQKINYLLTYLKVIFEY